mmetsp:Transcript_25764/g.48033  ORF Transcript_25764/g.48033 Transcript_25764/m.48033 type:complete len:575 (-) Transcript_25764:209-1933(-)
MDSGTNKSGPTVMQAAMANLEMNHDAALLDPLPCEGNGQASACAHSQLLFCQPLSETGLSLLASLRPDTLIESGFDFLGGLLGDAPKEILSDRGPKIVSNPPSLSKQPSKASVASSRKSMGAKVYSSDEPPQNPAYPLDQEIVPVKTSSKLPGGPEVTCGLPSFLTACQGPPVIENNAEDKNEQGGSVGSDGNSTISTFHVPPGQIFLDMDNPLMKHQKEIELRQKVKQETSTLRSIRKFGRKPKSREYSLEKFLSKQGQRKLKSTNTVATKKIRVSRLDMKKAKKQAKEYQEEQSQRQERVFNVTPKSKLMKFKNLIGKNKVASEETKNLSRSLRSVQDTSSRRGRSRDMSRSNKAQRGRSKSLGRQRHSQGQEHGRGRSRSLEVGNKPLPDTLPSPPGSSKRRRRSRSMDQRAPQQDLQAQQAQKLPTKSMDENKQNHVKTRSKSVERRDQPTPTEIFPASASTTQDASRKSSSKLVECREQPDMGVNGIREKKGDEIGDVVVQPRSPRSTSKGPETKKVGRGRSKERGVPIKGADTPLGQRRGRRPSRGHDLKQNKSQRKSPMSRSTKAVV